MKTLASGYKWLDHHAPTVAIKESMSNRSGIKWSSPEVHHDLEDGTEYMVSKSEGDPKLGGVADSLAGWIKFRTTLID